MSVVSHVCSNSEKTARKEATDAKMQPYCCCMYEVCVDYITKSNLMLRTSMSVTCQRCLRSEVAIKRLDAAGEWLVTLWNYGLPSLERHERQAAPSKTKHEEHEQERFLLSSQSHLLLVEQTLEIIILQSLSANERVHTTSSTCIRAAQQFQQSRYLRHY